MGIYSRLLAFLVGPGLVLTLGACSYAAVTAYVLGRCDAKFGCSGGVMIIAIVCGLAMLCSLAGHVVACLALRKLVLRLRAAQLLAVVSVLSVGQVGLYLSIGRYLPGETVIGMMLSWSVISTLLAVAVLAVVRRWAPNESLQPTLHRRLG